MRTGLSRAALGALAVLAVPAMAGDVRWRTNTADNRIGLAHEIMPETDTVADGLRLLAAGSNRHIVVRVADTPDDAQHAALAEHGVTLLRPLGAGAWFAALDGAALNADAAAAVAGLEAAEPIQPVFKLHPHLAQGLEPDWAIVSDEVPGDPIIGAYVQFHRDIDVLGEGADLVGLYGAVVRDHADAVDVLVIELPLSAVGDLASEDAVQWLEPALPRLGETNAENRALTQADQAQAAPYNLDGSGVTVMVYDGGRALSTHGDFGGRLTTRDSSGLSDHATHVSGTIGGNGAGSGGANRGMAPGVILESYGFQYDGSGIFLYTNPGDIQADYNQAINVHGADIANNSIGTNTETNGFPCSIQGDYGVTSQLIDNIVRGSLGAPMRIVWANGNERQGSRCDVEGFGDYYSTAPPATAKNHITVGALNANNDSMTSFSSWGPVDDGRLKPDISAPGCQSNGDGGVTSTASNGGYNVKCGTSMAAPTVTGLAALIMEDYRVQFPARPDPRNSTLKVLLAHSAVDRGNTGPDYQFGYGSVRVQDTIDHLRGGESAIQEGSVSHGAVAQYEVSVSGGSGPLKVTLAWDDAAGTPNVVPSLVNDLDLVVTSPGGTRHYPWTLNPGNPGAAAVRTQVDRVNNIEQVVVDSPQSGTWSVEVHGFDVGVGPQPFSIAATPGIAVTGISIVLPGGAPSEMAPNAPVSFDVQVTANGQSLVGTPELVYRYDGGSFLTAALAPLGGNNYQATLPAAACGDTPEFYIEAEGTVSGVVTLPAGAPGNLLAAAVGEEMVVFADDFESDTGWTATNQGASSGDWERGVPVNDGSWDYDPISDADGSGQCYLTDNAPGNTDVDGGTVRLLSPALDLSGGGITISYEYYAYLTDASTDLLLVEIGPGPAGPWTVIANHNTNGGTSWRAHTITQADLDNAGLALTSTMRMRFSANDANPQSINESGLDAFRITRFGCSGTFPDCNNNGVDDADDISGGTSQDCDGNGVPDECQADGDNDGTIDACDGCPADPDKTAPGACGCGVADDDSDGDGVADCNDICPGGDDNADADGDGTPDFCDGCPNDPDKMGPGVCGCGVSDDDSDGDGVADCNDVCAGGDDNADADMDGVPDFCDACPNDANDDSDGDGVCDSADICPGGDDNVDGDGDGTPDFCDACPNDANDDSDGDGVCDSADICPGGDDNVDGDGDGTPDFCDACPNDANDDSDGDGVCDSADICPGGDDNVDSDGDGTPDFCDGCPNDPDKTDPGDCGCGVPDACDCPGDANGDSEVDLDDLLLLLTNFGRTDVAPFTSGDADGDGDVDLEDLLLLLANFGTICS